MLVPILEDIVGWNPLRIRALFERQGLQIDGWDKIRTDILTIGGVGPAAPREARRA